MADQTATAEPNPNGAAAASSDATQNTGSATATTNATAEPTIPLSRFNEVNNRLKQLEREREQAAEAARKADEERARKQGEWQSLAESHAARISELEPFRAQAERYEAALRAKVAQERAGLPAHITALLDRLDPAEQLEWLAANADAVRPQQSTNGAASRGNGPGPRASATSTADAVEQNYRALKGSGAYSAL